MSVNKVILLGNVGTAPKITELENNKVATFSLATSKRYKDRRGDMQEETTWHNIVSYGRIAELVEKYVSKGTQVFVEGEIRTRKYTDREGKEHSVFEILCNNIQFFGQKTEQRQSNNYDNDLPV